jgi:cell division protein FtsL
MHPRKSFFVVLAILVVVVIAALGWQRRTANALRGEIARQHAQARERARLEAEHRRLLAAQPTEGELEVVLASQMAAEQLRAKLTTMRRREEAAARAVAAQRAADSEAAIPSLQGNLLAARLWQNAGQATPDAAFQTTLWASAAGDIDSLTDLLTFDADARNQATATFDRLPPALQNELGTPERLIALLTAVDVPLGSASILGQYPNATDTKVAARLIDADGKSKVAMFSLQTDGARWRLQVPAAVVEKYAGWLHIPAAGP